MNWILLITLSVLSPLVTHGLLDMVVLPSAIHKQGDTVTIECKTDELKRFEILKLVKMVDNDDGSQEHTIALNGNLQAPFTTMGRYMLENTEENLNQGKMVLKITDVQGGDRGAYSCIHIPSEDPIPEETLQVLVPPKEVYIQYKDEQGSYVRADPDETVVFTEGQPSEVQCIVNVEGSDKYPDVTVMLGDQNVEVSAEQVDGSEFRDGLYDEFSTTTLTGLQSITSDANGKQLQCEAVMPEHGATVPARITIEVQYAPKLECSQQTVRAKVGQEAMLKCTGSSNPAPEKITWTWMNGDGEVNAVHGQDPIDNYHVMVSDDKSEFTLHIQEVGETDFRVYKLSVDNGAGTSQVEVTLEEEPVVTPAPTQAPTEKPEDGDSKEVETEKVTTGASCGTVSLLLITLLVLAQLL